MQNIIIVIHLIIVVALVGAVLLQRSEGGGLGIGGGSGFMTARGAANTLTRTTAILAALFFMTSLGLSVLARYQERPGDIFEQLQRNQPAGSQQGGNGILDQLGGRPSQPAGESAPSDVPAPAEGAAPAEPQVPSGQ
jgi:preprotein translocase subunit SecG